jgi:hypothetical protein
MRLSLASSKNNLPKPCEHPIFGILASFQMFASNLHCGILNIGARDD